MKSTTESFIGRDALPLNVKHEIALFFQAAGRRPKASTDIAGSLTYGYGDLDEYGFWEYQL